MNTEHIMNRLAFLALLALAFVLPWEDSLMLRGVGSIGRLFTMLLLAVGSLALVLPGGIRLRRPSVFIVLLLVFTLWSAASFFWSLDQAETIGQIIIRAQLFLLVFFVWQLVDSRERRLAVFQAYVLGCMAAAGSAIINYLLGSEAVYQRYSVTGVDPNEFATFLALGIPMAWIILISGRHRVLFWPTLLFIPLALFGILLTSSRGGALVALLALSLIPLTLTALPRRRRAALWLVAVLGLGGLVVAAPQLAELLDTSLARLSSTSRELSSGTLNERSELWSAGFVLLGHHPFLGVGAGAFPLAVRPFAGVEKVAHNSYVSVFVELGPVGLLLLVSIFLAAGIPLARLSYSERISYLILLGTLALGMFPLTWESRKITWMVLALVTTPVALVLAGMRHPRAAGESHA